MTNESIIDNVAKMRKAWALVFELPCLPDSVLYRWLCFFPVQDVELAFQKAAGWQRRRGRPTTSSQIRNRIQDTLYWLRNTKQEGTR